MKKFAYWLHILDTISHYSSDNSMCSNSGNKSRKPRKGRNLGEGHGEMKFLKSSHSVVIVIVSKLYKKKVSQLQSIQSKKTIRQALKKRMEGLKKL